MIVVQKKMQAKTGQDAIKMEFAQSYQRIRFNSAERSNYKYALLNLAN